MSLWTLQADTPRRQADPTPTPRHPQFAEVTSSSVLMGLSAHHASPDTRAPPVFLEARSICVFSSAAHPASLSFPSDRSAVKAGRWVCGVCPSRLCPHHVTVQEGCGLFCPPHFLRTHGLTCDFLRLRGHPLGETRGGSPTRNPGTYPGFTPVFPSWGADAQHSVVSSRGVTHGRNSRRMVSSPFTSWTRF